MTEAFLTLAFLWLIAAMTPGPNFFAVMHVAVTQGRGAAFACALGTVLGTAIWALAGFFGLKALFTALPAAAVAIKLFGGGYLIWVAIGFWRASSKPTEKHLEATAGSAFWFGVATNLANPKTAAFAASLFAVALPPGTDIGISLLAVVMICTISTCWYGIVSRVGSGAVFARAYARARSSVLRATSVIFAGFGLKLWTETIWESADGP